MQICEKDKCVGCGACVNTCKRKAICMKEDKEGFLYPFIDDKQCVLCGACKNACPVLNCHDEVLGMQQMYAAYNDNIQERLESSSGGVFSIFAREILRRGGVVYGAAMDNQHKVCHIGITNEKDLAFLKGSKYLQSEIGATYAEAEMFLRSGRWVYFSGTPCQIEGLLSYLNVTYDRLVTQDLICHGVPSPMVWRKYLSSLKKKSGSAVNKVSFRNKATGWSDYSLEIQFLNGKNYTKMHHEDLYMKSFLQNYSLRKSCYACQFKKLNRIADITLADFWGINEVDEKMNDNKGTSLVVIHSNKGREIWDNIKGHIVWQEVEKEGALRYNSAMIQSVNCPAERELFLKSIRRRGFEWSARKYINHNSRSVRAYFFGGLRKIYRLFRRWRH